MAKWVIDSTTLCDIADAIRTQLGETEEYGVDDLADKILEIGGTSPSSGPTIEIGTFVPVNKTSIFEIDTELAEVHGVIITRTTSTSFANSITAYVSCNAVGGNTGSASIYGTSVFSNWGNPGVSRATANPLDFDEGYLMVDIATNFSTSSYFANGETYSYIIY